ncbi:RidA family protein [Actinotalea sp. M2MS4P-6]|uniref:RidA family protein n=1 Tax=Actinotalea sp. M2MS4P-6 TaxID=2983762 RepID=UPI0021E36E42|nr:RidA family protein [Actinotalea sp. M2MS4P-6]MCV2393012.1 RidA family protein [Actinotalea sp. M2MS4P-6]
MTSIVRTTTPYSYSAAVRAADYVFLGLHRGFGDTFDEQLDGALGGVRETLAGHDVPLEALVSVHVWLRDIDDLPAMEHGFTRHFHEGEFPARMTSTTAFIDDDCMVMIDGVAYTR